MKYTDLVFETLVNTDNKGFLQQINFPGELDTEHITITAKKEGKLWRINVIAKDEIGKLIVKTWNKLKESSGLYRDDYVLILDYILKEA